MKLRLKCVKVVSHTVIFEGVEVVVQTYKFEYMAGVNKYDTCIQTMTPLPCKQGDDVYLNIGE